MSTRKVLVDEEFFLLLGATSVEWGEPDEDGFYTPTIRRDRCPDCDEIPQNRIHHDRTLKAYHPYGRLAR